MKVCLDQTTFEKSVSQPQIPATLRGVPHADDRKVLKGILWWLLAGPRLGTRETFSNFYLSANP